MVTKVVLIAGAGRSGSTFLSQLLSQNDDCQNVGQIRHLPMSFGKDRICSCGQSLSVCDFWGPVAARMVEAHGVSVMDDIKSAFAGFQASSNAQNTWSDPAARESIAAENSRFLELFGDMYRFAGEHGGNRVLIDSSKIPTVALALSLIGDVSLYTLNLVRDPRAVAVSWAKLVKKPAVQKNRCRNWNMRVNQMKEIEDIAGQPFLRVKYEDFASDPRAMLEEIQNWAELEPDTSFFTDSRSADVSWARTHLFPPANEEVLQKQATSIEIRPSDAWKSDDNEKIRRMAEKINFPKARKVGYQKSVM